MLELPELVMDRVLYPTSNFISVLSVRDGWGSCSAPADFLNLNQDEEGILVLGIPLKVHSLS